MDVAAADRRPVRVLVRVRPPLIAEEASSQCCTVVDNATVRLENGSSVIETTFHAALGPGATQEDASRHIQQVAEDAWKGINSSILAYGQTGSGKTYTMYGGMSSSISGCWGRHPHQRRYLAIACTEHPSEHEPFDRMDTIMQLLSFGTQQRSVRQTALNHHSSRGHTLLQLHVEIKNRLQDTNTLKASIVFADLAGSEPHPGGRIEPNSHAAETRCISMSLSALVSVVSALSSGHRHVPYRDSKLTCLMRHALGGNCQTCASVLLLCLKSHHESTDVQFASRAAAIVNNVVRNAHEDLSGLLEMKNDEIRRLKAALQQFGNNPSKTRHEASLQEHDISKRSQYKILERRVVALKQALESERIRVRQLEALSSRTPLSADGHHEWDFSTRLHDRPQSACQSSGQAKYSAYRGGKTSAGAQRNRISQNIVHTSGMYQSMSTPTSNAVSPCPSRRRPKTNLPRPVSACLPQAPGSRSVGVAGLYQRARQASPRLSSARRKIVEEDTIRQIGQQMMRDRHPCMRTCTSEADMARPVGFGYSDAGVAKLMEQYSSLFKELGIHDGIPFQPGTSGKEVQPVRRKTLSQHASSRRGPVHADAVYKEAPCTGESLSGHAGRLQPAATQFGLSGILSSSRKTQHSLPQRISNALLGTPLPTQGSGFGLSAILKGARSGSDKISIISENPAVTLKQLESV